MVSHKTSYSVRAETCQLSNANMRGTAMQALLAGPKKSALPAQRRDTQASAYLPLIGSIRTA